MNKEEIRFRIIASIKDVFDKDLIDDEELHLFENDLDIILNDYCIELKSTELVPFDNSNFIILKNYLGTKQLEGYSSNTLKQYKRHIEIMFNNIGKKISEITTNDLRYHFASYQKAHDISNVSLDNMRRVYNSFFKWCVQEKIISENPCERIKAFKSTKKQVKPFTATEIETLCDACKNVRDRAMIEFLYSTGVRVTELVSLDKRDIDFTRASVIVRHGKGDKERTVYISEKCMYWLKKYLNERKDDDPCLWYGKFGRLSKRGVEMIIQKLGEKTDIEAFPHKFRHTLATDMIARNAPVQVVQKILGHEDISTTMIYVDVKDSEAENIHKKLIV